MAERLSKTTCLPYEFTSDFELVAITPSINDKCDVTLRFGDAREYQIAWLDLRALQSFLAFQRELASRYGVWVGHKTQRGESAYARRSGWFFAVAQAMHAASVAA